MLYSHLRVWTHDGKIWHSFYRPGTRDMSMGESKPWDIEKTMAWAKMHKMTILDERAKEV